MSGKPITGRQVFLVTAGAFGVIIAVNLYMAVQAVETFPGLEVRNGYVASQSFEAERKAQQALGWSTALAYADGALRLTITGADGRPVRPQALSAVLARPTTTRDDREIAFAFDGTAHVARLDIAPGNWNLWLKATAGDGTLFRQRLVLHVKPRP